VVSVSGGSLNLHALRLTHVIPSERDSIYSITLLNEDVFIAGAKNQEIEVYNAMSMKCRRRLRVPGLGPVVNSLVACNVNNCLYVSDANNGVIHRVQLLGSNAVKKWSVANEPAGLSVNCGSNVVVACWGASKLQEYATHGTLVREIILQHAGVTKPWHAIQLSTGDYVVSQDTSPGMVVTVGVNGQVVQSYGRSRMSNIGQMKYPTGLAVTDKGEILVADDLNHRVLLIDSSLCSGEELTLPVDSGIRRPSGLCLDETRGRLYVSEYVGGRVLVFEGAAVKQ